MVEIIPKPPQKLPAWQNILFYASLVILLIVFLSYFVLDPFINNLSKELEQLEETLAREKTEEEISLEQEIFGYQKKITVFSGLIKEHIFTSGFFTVLEEISHPKVKFAELTLNPFEGTALLSGEAEDFSALGQQLLILKGKSGVEDLSLSNISIGRQGKIDFALKLSLNSQLFDK